MHSLISGFEFILRGGFMMYPLLISALISISVIIERVLIFKRRFQTTNDFRFKVFDAIKSGKLADAEKLCSEIQTPVSSVIANGIGHFKNSIEEMELSMKNAAEEWVPLLEKRVDIIDTVITAAPLMGLLGTITGMMASFQVLSEKGVNEPNAITGGVAEALIATATGLVIALFSLIAYNYLSAKIKVFIYDLEAVASRLVEIRMSAERTGK